MSLPKATGTNYGGISSLFIALRTSLQGLLTTTDAPTVSLSQAFITANFTQVEFTRESGHYDEATEPTAHGMAYRHAIEVQLLRDRLDIRTHLRTYRNRQLVALVTDYNGIVRLIADEREGIYLADEKHTGKKVRDTNHVLYRLSGLTTHESRLVTIT